MAKILFITFGDFNGHATLKRATGLAKPLCDLGYDVAIAIQDTAANREKSQLEWPGGSFFWLDNVVDSRKERTEKQKVVAEFDPDVIWICGVGFRNLVKRSRKNQILLADHSELFSSLSTIPKHRRFWELLLEYFNLFNFDGHVCASDYLVNKYNQRQKIFGFKKPVLKLSYAYHTSFLEVDETLQAKLKDSYKGRKVFLYVGSFWENYGIWDMMKVFETLVQFRNDIVFILIGRGPEKDNVIDWIHKNKFDDFILPMGYVEESKLSTYFSISDCFLLPMRNTKQDIARCPSKLFLYIAWEKPIITCNIGEVASNLMDKGTYYQTQDLDSMTTVISHFIQGNSNLAFVNKELHSWESRARDFDLWLKNKFSKLFRS
jgi:glycosyltransferase involved in cell wall biosynthesis